MQTKRIAIIIIFIATINCYFFALMTKREPIAFEYAFEGGYSHYDPIATNFQDRFGDGQGHLISFGAPIESIEYDPLYIFNKDESWIDYVILFSAEPLFYQFHPVITYGDTSESEYYYRVDEHGRNINCAIIE